MSSPSGEQANPRAGSSVDRGAERRSAVKPAESRTSRSSHLSRDAQAGDRGFAHSGAAYSPPADLSDDGGAVFEVPFEAFFSGADEAAANMPPEPPLSEPTFKRSRRAPLETARESSAPQADQYERSSASRAARASEREQSSTAKQRPERSLKGRALGYLSRREYSRAELSRKLMPYTEDADALEVLLDSLEREGWLSDARFAESVVHRRASRVGAGRIVSELKRHAVGEALIEEVSSQLRETELVRARTVWQKKYGQLPETPAERARQARFLAARGFSMSIIGKILKGIEEDWSDN
ncbi:recombination regulator RecX [Paraburkholderia sp. CNPSo 3076]|uniref:recombination regulator RecX n=1 Tax=Paraburkholderia sp. CNPSo 3076 TaxID=2940936 RepID=UPI0022506961|nr:recombination regulator RecX [Paraburkholderia sp. CNPSo 3076]MCX5545035.1 recombination regulator RecX [Paraburkholderia sp. CNPSo 3076]